jgi:hypothetical protein
VTPEDPSVPAEGEPDASADAAPAPGDRDVRVRDGEVEWRCQLCATWTPLLEPACRGCGSARAGFGPAEESAPPKPIVGPMAGLAASAVLPGLGHLLRGVSGLGLAILLLWVLWAGGAFISRRGMVSITVVLVLAAVTLWAVSLLDLWRRAAEATPLVTGQLLARVTVGVTALLIVVAIGGGLAAGG